MRQECERMVTVFGPVKPAVWWHKPIGMPDNAWPSVYNRGWSRHVTNTDALKITFWHMFHARTYSLLLSLIYICGNRIHFFLNGSFRFDQTWETLWAQHYVNERWHNAVTTNGSADENSLTLLRRRLKHILLKHAISCNNNNNKYHSPYDVQYDFCLLYIYW